MPFKLPEWVTILEYTFPTSMEIHWQKSSPGGISFPSLPRNGKGAENFKILEKRQGLRWRKKLLVLENSSLFCKKERGNWAIGKGKIYLI